MGQRGPPAYGTLWELLARIDIEELSQASYVAWQAQSADAYTVDGKVLRGSKRAAIHLLLQMPLAGKIIGLDAAP